MIGRCINVKCRKEIELFESRISLTSWVQPKRYSFGYDFFHSSEINDVKIAKNILKKQIKRPDFKVKCAHCGNILSARDCYFHNILANKFTALERIAHSREHKTYYNELNNRYLP